MERFLCIHGHFYQPPRENPWLETIEMQDSAYPYHDWNETITAQCYAPNMSSRILDGEKRIVDIVSNYSKVSFDFGPTLMSWLETKSPETYRGILDADKASQKAHSGHGNAIAQCYNHMIMPLANSRDKQTQILWGIKDFTHRFDRSPEGMWLPETAADLETLDMLARQHISFVILAPHQAWRARRIGTGKWKDVSGSRIDPTRPYLCRLPTGRSIHIFFYDGPISQAVAFDKLLDSGEDFANRLISGFLDSRAWPQIMHIAADGETYGHHHKFGDMALAYALEFIEKNGLATLTNYGEYLERYPVGSEVQIFENTSWSCAHGIERWRSDCGCSSGGLQGWTQGWRTPLRDALDWLRDRLAAQYQEEATRYLINPWLARDNYIEAVLDRSAANMEQFFLKFGRSGLTKSEKITVLKLLETQRHAMLMYTSCGWFFEELSRIETIQILQYAGRAIQLSEEVCRDSIEETFLGKLEKAGSNLPEHGDGASIYRRFVKSSSVDLRKVAAHFAVSSLFRQYGETAQIYSYDVTQYDHYSQQVGQTRLGIGKVSVTSRITGEIAPISFCVFSLGGHALNGGVRSYLGTEAYQLMKDETTRAFETGALAEIIRLMDRHFGTHNYSLADLFRDEQREILGHLITEGIDQIEALCQEMYEKNKILMNFLTHVKMPIPSAFLYSVQVKLDKDIKKGFQEEQINREKTRELLGEAQRWGVELDYVGIEYSARQRLERLMERFSANPCELVALRRIGEVMELIRALPIEANYWQVQNIYYKMAKTVYGDFVERAQQGEEAAHHWIAAFRETGELLHMNVCILLP